MRNRQIPSLRAKRSNPKKQYINRVYAYVWIAAVVRTSLPRNDATRFWHIEKKDACLQLTT